MLDLIDDETWQTKKKISRKERYARYLNSYEWKRIRDRVQARSDGVCERCHLYQSEHVHHLTYERIFHESLDDLQDVCGWCHEYLHGLRSHDPAWDWYPRNTTSDGAELAHIFTCNMEYRSRGTKWHEFYKDCLEESESYMRYHKEKQERSGYYIDPKTHD